jgi:copper(I)-binding protein
MPRALCTLLFGLGVFVAVWNPAATRAHSFQVAEIMVGHPWAPPSAGPDGVALLSLLNRGAEDLLIGANSPIAAEVALTDSAAGGSVLKALVLGPNKPVALRQGRLVLALKGLKTPLTEGQKFPLTLVFEKAGTLTVEVFVERSPS